VLTGGYTSRELVSLDADPSSLSYGQSLAATTTLTGVNRERWALSPSGNLAAVPCEQLFYGPLSIVDTNPTHSTYMQVVASPSLPGVFSADMAVACAFTHDDRYALLLWRGLSGNGLAVFDLVAGTWLDFGLAPGAQSFPIPQQDLNSMDIAHDDSFVAVAFDTGWARIDLNYLTPTNSSFHQYAPGTGQLPNCGSASLSHDSLKLAVTTQSTAGVARCVFINTSTGALASATTLPGATYMTTTAWQQISTIPVTYCTSGISSSGCQATIQAVGTASATHASSFTIGVSNVDGQKPGTIVYGVSGRVEVPWGTTTGYWCIEWPTQSTTVQLAGGTKGACDGVLSLDWNSWFASHPGALGTPFAVGQFVQAQGWFRDPTNMKTTMLSNAVEFPIAP
jgi:hypothetical protein